MGVVAKEVAIDEVNKFLDRQEFNEEARKEDSAKIQIGILVKSVEDGYVTFNDDETVTQKLQYPLADGDTTELKYDYRFEIGQYRTKTKGTDPYGDPVGYTVARLSLISAKKLPTAVFEKLKAQDYNRARALSVFF